MSASILNNRVRSLLAALESLDEVSAVLKLQLRSQLATDISVMSEMDEYENSLCDRDHELFPVLDDAIEMLLIERNAYISEACRELPIAKVKIIPERKN